VAVTAFEDWPLPPEPFGGRRGDGVALADPAVRVAKAPRRCGWVGRWPRS
jgi:hypothetical protein